MPAPDLPPPISFGTIARPLAVHLHPRLVTPEQLAGGVVLMIDNLRASVTIAAALTAGAVSVRPVLTVEEAFEHRRRLHAANPGPPGARNDHPHHPASPHPSSAKPITIPLLGGERGGTLVDGFDLDNSPSSYTAHKCARKNIIFTTTNGTAALLHARLAALVLVASMANVTAIASAIANDPRPVHILCAGTRDEIGLDDCLPAGAIVERLLAAGRSLVQDDSARLCLRAWRDATKRSVLDAMRDTRGGRNLVSIGLDADIQFCSRLDTLPVVPVFDPATGLITAG